MPATTRTAIEQAATTIRALLEREVKLREGLEAIAIGEGLADVIARQALQETDNAG